MSLVELITAAALAAGGRCVLAAEKSWAYFPHFKDPQTLTLITLRAGVAAAIERKIAR